MRTTQTTGTGDFPHNNFRTTRCDRKPGDARHRYIKVVHLVSRNLSINSEGLQPLPKISLIIIHVHTGEAAVQ